ncbi:MAG: cytochrome-c peroxidase [Sphingobacteriales bacterium]
MKKILVILLAGVVAVGLMEACRKTDDSAPDTQSLTLSIPQGWPQPENIFSSNPLTQQGFDLGKKLFYDGRLSKDGNFPCSSCHQQFAGFATFDHTLSHGFNNQFTTRNAPGLFNLAWYKEFHWDGGINHLEVQPLAPITASNEMAETIENVIAKLKADPAYPKLFKAAFGTEQINSQLMLRALSQFMGMMVSSNSKYDKVMRGQSSFTDAEMRGYKLFQANCASCHKEPLFTDQSYRNTGLPMDPSLKDAGRMRITRLPSDSLKFKVPSLRNVMVTAPYGHDGRLISVGAVIDHYRFNVVNGPTTDPLVKNKINLDVFAKNDLIIFMRTLTDSSFLADKRFAEE